MNNEQITKNPIQDLIDRLDDSKDIKILEKKSRNKRWSYFGALITFAITIAGIAVAAISYSGVIEANSFTGYQFVIILAIVIFVVFLFALLYVLLMKSTLSDLSRSYSDIRKIANFFKIIFDQSDKQNKINVSISENIKYAPVSNLITWENSKDIEIESKEVWAYSYSLKWLNEEYKTEEGERIIRMREILVELLAYPTHRYLFITPKKKSDTNLKSNPINKAISEFIIELEKEEPLKSEERKKILRENDLPENLITKFKNKVKLTKDEIKNFRLEKRFRSIEIDYSIPIPNDFAIYKGFSEGNNHSKKIVVFNTADFNDNDTNSNKSKDERKYDLRFYKKDHVNRVEEWFVNVWKQKTEQGLYD